MSDIQAIRADLDRVQMELDFASVRGVGHPAHGDLIKLVRHGNTLLSALTAAEARAEAAEDRVGELEEIRKAARQILQGASGHYMNAEDRWILESRLDDYDAKGTPDDR